MPLIKADRVKETSTSTGATTFTLAGAVVGFRAFSSVCSVGDTFYYVIDSDSGSEWETGLGTYSATNTLTRTTVHASSNGGSLVVFSAGTKNVYISVTANQINPASSTGARSLVVRNDSGTVAVTADASTSGTPPNLLSVTGPAHTGVTGDYNDIYFNLARTIQLASITSTVRPIRITSPTYTATSAVSPINGAYTVHITGAPTASTNVTFNNRAALGIFTSNDTAKGLVIESTTWTSGQQSANLIECNRLSNTGGLFAVTGNGCVYITPMGKTGIQDSSFVITAPNHTALGSSSEYLDVNWNLSRTVQWDAGNISTQRAVRISQPTYSFVSASTITNAVTVQIDGAPVAGTNATITNPIALRALTGQAAAKGIVVQGAASQTGNLQEWQNSSSAILAKIESNGSLTAPRGSFLQTVANSTALSAQAAPQAINTVGYSLSCSNSDGLTTLQLIHDGRFSITQRPSGGFFRNACLTVTASADTPTLAAGNNDFYFNANATETSLASNYSGSCSVMEIACRTYAATSGTTTVTDAYGVYITKVPTAGSNVTIQRSYGIYVISDKNYSIGLAIGTSAAATSKGIQIQRTSGSGTGTNFEVVNGAGGSVLMSINHNGSITPATLADASASNNSIYYSSTAGKLVYKDSAGTVNNLY